MDRAERDNLTREIGQHLREHVDLYREPIRAWYRYWTPEAVRRRVWPGIIGVVREWRRGRYADLRQRVTAGELTAKEAAEVLRCATGLQMHQRDAKKAANDACTRSGRLAAALDEQLRLERDEVTPLDWHGAAIILYLHAVKTTELHRWDLNLTDFDAWPWDAWPCGEWPPVAVAAVDEEPRLSAWWALVRWAWAARPVEEEQTATPAAPPILTPRWLPKERKLTLGDAVAATYSKTAPNQMILLAAFEEAGWPLGIENPFRSGIGGRMPDPDTLKKTVENLNAKLSQSTLRFGISDSSATWRIKV